MNGPTPGYLAWRLSMAWRTEVDRALADLGLTHAQYSVLSSLRGLGRRALPTQRELADHTALDPIYVSKLARALEAQGLLTRTTDPHDTRAVRLALTTEGMTVADRAIRIVRSLLDDLTQPLGGLDGARTARFVADLELLLAHHAEGRAP